MKQQGFTLLYSLLISSIVLSIALGAFSLVQGEVLLSGTARDSQIALYASEAGLECVFYWDFYFSSFAADGTQDTITCFGQSIDVGGSPSSNFQFLNLENGASIDVTVTRNADFTTTVTSLGRNTSVPGARTVERALQARYIVTP